MTVKVTMIPGWDTKIERGLKQGVLAMTVDIQKRAVILAPKLTSALANSAIIGTVFNGYKVTFGSSRVPYARIQHEGGTIRPKNKPVLAWKDKSGNWHYAMSV